MDKATAERLFEYLNGFKSPNKKKNETLPLGFECKPGLSFGSLSMYQSLYEAMFPKAQEMYFAFDNLLAERNEVDVRSQQLWNSVMWPLSFPVEWPASHKAMFPTHWLYGFAQFRLAHGLERQQIYLRPWESPWSGPS